MCKEIRKISQKQFTGYKLAFKIDGEYYSVVTGIKYEKGKVPIVNNGQEINPNLGKLCPNKEHLIEHLIWMGEYGKINFGINYRISAIGKTFIFRTLRDAECVRKTGEVILKMTIKDDLVEGKMQSVLDHSVIGGKRIVRYELVEDK